MVVVVACAGARLEHVLIGGTRVRLAIARLDIHREVSLSCGKIPQAVALQTRQ